MSAAGSPTGSPTAGVADGLSGEQIAFRLMQATEAAAAAANAASQAVSALSGGSSGSMQHGGENRAEWYKVLPKPQNFEPKDREQELSGFRDWFWSLEQYIVAVDSSYASDLTYIRNHLDEELPLVEQTTEKTKRSAFLYGLLASLLKNRPLMLLKGVEQGNGLEAVRQLFKTCQPSSRNRSLALLHLIMQWPNFDMRAALLPQILKLEDSFREYEKIASPLADELRFAVLMKCLSGQLKTYLQVTLKDSTTYEEPRESALRFDTSTIRWTQSMSLGAPVSAAQDTSGPMDVDRIEKGKGKKGSKGKPFNKGKDKGKGKQKSKNSGEKGSNSGKGYGNQQSNWSSKGTSWHNNSWNSANDGSGKGGKSYKGGKSKDAGKGKDSNTCHRCGGHGHFARDCRGRLVGQDDSASANNDNKSDTHSKGGAANSGSVNRVSLAPPFMETSGRQLDFDISGMDELRGFTVSNVYMISQQFFMETTYKPETLYSTTPRPCSCFSDDFALDFHGICGGVDEFFSCGEHGKGDAVEYKLHKLCKLDDMEHYQQRVAEQFAFHLYDVVDCEGGCNRFKRCGDLHKPCKRSEDVHLWSLSKTVDCCSDFQMSCNVRAVSACSHVDIILDSGSDVTLIPMFMSDVGCQAPQTSETYLRDAQGKRIATSDVRDVSFSFSTVDGEVVNIKERAFFSDRVECPLISFGKLLKSGWGIESSGDGPPVLSHLNGARVELAFRNNSLVIAGDVRLVQSVRAISVDIPKPWQDLKRGWYEYNGHPMCSSAGNKFVDVTTDYLVVDWPYRTTLGHHDIRGWEVIELCEKIFPMDDRSAAIDGNYTRLLTILSKTVMSVADFGMVVTETELNPDPGRQSSGSGLQTSANPGSARMDTTGDRPVVEQTSQPSLPQTIAIQPNMSSVKIAGVDVTPTSAICVLRAACAYLQVSQSGSKFKLWNRILAALDKKAIQAERELAVVALEESQRKAESVHVATPPEDQGEIDAHCLTHLPYQPWCPACVMAKGKPEQHKTDLTRVQRRELPVISWDFAFTGKSCEGVDESSDQSKLTTLVMHDSHTGAVHCVPVNNKSQTRYMSQEVLRFINFTGHGKVALRCDQEPTMLQIQKLVQRARQRLNLSTVIENAKVGDHGSNAAVEKAIDRVRNQASVYLHALSTNIGFEILPRHPLFAWAFVHSSWTLTRFTVKAGTTPYELISGHGYNSTLCPFGCPVMVFVGDSVKQKGDSKWHRGIFLTKSMSNDMFLTAVGGTLKFSRSVKMIFPQWHEHMDQYRQVLTFPWQLEGSVGSRVNPTVRDPDITAFAVPGIDDEAADDPTEDTSVPLMIEDLVPMAGTGRRNTPPPPTAVVSAPADTSETATTATAMQDNAEPLTIDQAGLPAPSLQPPGPMTPGMEIAMDVSTGDVAEGETADVSEPDSKRPRLSAMRVGEETLFHVDVDNSEIMQELGEHGTLLSDENLHDSMFSAWDSDETPRELTEDDLWQPYSALEPTLDSLQLEKIDEYADSIEIERLLGMKVIANRADFTGELGTQLSAKFVRSWRKKTRKQCDSAGKVIGETQGWLRRSRLVAREYNWMDIREDVYSPSSSSSIVKLLPSLCMSDGFNTNCILGTLDIGDAFLQVDQPIPRVVRLGDRDFVIQKCLPGQREASKLWYLHFVKVLKEKFNAEVCKEQPCILRVGRKLAMLLHVDDVLFLGDEKWIEETFLPELRKDFKVSSTVVNFEKGGSVEFLKRYHVVEPFYSEITVHPEEKHIHSMFERYGKLNGKPPKLAKTPCYASSTPGDAKPQKPLSNEMAAEFRSLVGIAMYVAQERFDLQFATKTLAQSLKSPTMQSWIDLGRLIAYAKYSEHFALRMKRTSKGTSFQAGLREVETENNMNVIETFSDSDWSNRSTSSAIHVLNGNVIWSTSRTQKCVALSSTEAEWYAATSGVCDGLFSDMSSVFFAMMRLKH